MIEGERNEQLVRFPVRGVVFVDDRLRRVWLDAISVIDQGEGSKGREEE